MSMLGDFFNPGQVAARQNTDLARQYSSGLEFTPYNVYSGLGSMTSAGGGTQFGLSGPLANISSQLAGLNLQSGLTPTQQRMFEQLQGVGLTDLGTATAQQYGLMRQMVAPEQAQARSAMENRLAAQGMLGASGGAARMGALLQQQAQQDLGLQQAAFGQALQGRQQDIGLFGQALNMAEQQRMLQSPEYMMGLLGQQGRTIAGLEALPMQMMGQYGLQAGQHEYQALADRTKMMYEAEAAQNLAEAQTRGILPNLILGGIGAGINSLTGGAGLFSGGMDYLKGMFGEQRMGLGVQTGYYGGVGDVLSGREWEMF